MEGEILTEMSIVITFSLLMLEGTRVYPKVSGLAACSENCKW
jgi:hypothetical protein